MDDKEIKIKRLMHRSCNRGFKETDIFLGKFAEKYISSLSEQELDDFEDFLNESDTDIYNWITKREEVSKKYINTSLIKKIFNFNYIE